MDCRSWFFGAIVALAAAVSGCGKSDSASAPVARADSPYVAGSEPAGAVPVGEARAAAQDQDEVVLVGRIGGSEKPFVDGLAAFTIVDPKVPHCGAEEGCPTPWDYCCTQDQVAGNTAVVKLVDESGHPVEDDARELLGVKELSLVVVHGRAERDAEGNLAVLADKVYVKP